MFIAFFMGPTIEPVYTKIEIKRSAGNESGGGETKVMAQKCFAVTR